MFLLSVPAFAAPTLITYTANDLGSGRWQYEYAITNESLTKGITEFTIWFEYGFYDNIAIETIGVSDGLWDEIVTQPTQIQPFDPFNGMYDALAMQDGIGIGQTGSGFMISFDWLGKGSPMSQPYEIIDPGTFETIYKNTTVSNAAPVVPVPGALVLGIIGIGIVKLRKK